MQATTNLSASEREPLVYLRMRWLIRLCKQGALIACLATLVGCAGFRAANVPLARADPAHGYRPSNPAQHRDSGPVHMLLAFSGGGTRAAAFAYGVLEELRDTEVLVAGERKRLLDEIDTISGVSGGSFPAAYYGLFGDRIFEEFEPRFLRRNVQLAILLQALRPVNLLRLTTASLSRSDLAAQYYDKKVFDGATFADLGRTRGPLVYINSTDLSGGSRFTFSQEQFDVICSDLDEFPVARAVAASSAVPGLLSPVTLKNHAGSCGLEVPDDLREALKVRVSDPRRYRVAEEILSYRDAAKKPYIHLVDGGISDNLGLRASLELMSLAGGAKALVQKDDRTMPEHLLIIVVNAERDADPAIDLSYASPSLAALMSSVSGAQIRRYNFETIQLMRRSVHSAAAALRVRDSPSALTWSRSTSHYSKKKTSATTSGCSLLTFRCPTTRSTGCAAQGASCCANPPYFKISCVPYTERDERNRGDLHDYPQEALGSNCGAGLGNPRALDGRAGVRAAGLLARSTGRRHAHRASRAGTGGPALRRRARRTDRSDRALPGRAAGDHAAGGDLSDPDRAGGALPREAQE